MENQYPHLQSVPETEIEWFGALMSLARFLRSPEGCPWDQKQRAIDFAKFAGEETDEYVEALAKDDNDNAEEEFGDSLFVLLASMAAAEAEGRFDLRGAMARVHEKMVRRHAHVFDNEKASTPEEAVEAWNRIKAEEKARKRG
jgi:tetrapyrrole methylase family protein/MazG family protein